MKLWNKIKSFFVRHKQSAAISIVSNYYATNLGDFGHITNAGDFLTFEQMRKLIIQKQDCEVFKEIHS